MIRPWFPDVSGTRCLIGGRDCWILVGFHVKQPMTSQRQVYDIKYDPVPWRFEDDATGDWWLVIGGHRNIVHIYLFLTAMCHRVLKQMYMNVCIIMYTTIYIYVCTLVCIYIYNMCVCIMCFNNVLIYTYSIHVYVYVCINICVFIYIYTYILCVCYILVGIQRYAQI